MQWQATTHVNFGGTFAMEPGQTVSGERLSGYKALSTAIELGWLIPVASLPELRPEPPTIWERLMLDEDQDDILHLPA